MAEDLNNEYEKSRRMAQRQFRKDINGFRQRRRLELEDLLRTEKEKPEEIQDAEKIEWIMRELESCDSDQGT